MFRQVVLRRQVHREEFTVVDPRKPARDTRARNRVFFVTVIAAVVVGLWLAR